MNLPIVNKCGDCKACCTVLGVKALQKKDYQPCNHLCEAGCSVYGDRPKECQTYECVWLAGNLSDENYRPDKIGVILEIADTPIGRCLVVREVRDGAAREASHYVLSVAKQAQAYVYLITSNRRKAYFPPWAEHLKEKADQIIYKTWQEEKRVAQQQKEDRSAKKAKRKQRKLAKRRNR